MAKEFLAEGGKVPYDIGVCIEHCCATHGCKYGKPDCAVKVLGYAQAYPCEFCGDCEIEELKAMEIQHCCSIRHCCKDKSCRVFIPRSRYEQLAEDASLLAALMDAGVDNWEGWSEVTLTND